MRYMEATERESFTLAMELKRDGERDDALCDGHGLHED